MVTGGRRGILVGCLLVVALLALQLQASESARTYFVLRIDCGSNTSATKAGHEWSADVHFNGGEVKRISNAQVLQGGLTEVESTLRTFPSANGGCYNVPVDPGRYNIRAGFGYYNYDGTNSPPFFNITVQGVPAATIAMPAFESSKGGGGRMRRGALYQDFIAPAESGRVDFCLVPFSSQYSILSDAKGDSITPFINTLEITPVDWLAYDPQQVNPNQVMANTFRFNLGGPLVGPEPQDPGFRVWSADPYSNYTYRYAATNIFGAGQQPDFLPPKVFQSARMATPAEGNKTGFVISGLWPMDMTHAWYLRLYFAEINPAVKKPGDRVFDIIVGVSLGDGTILRLTTPGSFDILSVAAPFTAVSAAIAFTFDGMPMYEQELVIGVATLNSSQYPAIISAAELYELIPLPSGSNNNLQQPGGGALPPPVPSTATPVATFAPPPPSGLSGGAIAAIVLGVIMGVAIIGGAVYYFAYKRKNNPMPFSNLGEEHA